MGTPKFYVQSVSDFNQEGTLNSNVCYYTYIYILYVLYNQKQLNILQSESINIILDHTSHKVLYSTMRYVVLKKMLLCYLCYVLCILFFIKRTFVLCLVRDVVPKVSSSAIGATNFFPIQWQVRHFQRTFVLRLVRDVVPKVSGSAIGATNFFPIQWQLQHLLSLHPYVAVAATAAANNDVTRLLEIA